MWISGEFNPANNNTYGIDSQIMEFKGINYEYRICHDYYGTDGSDDAHSGTSYQAANVLHETTDSRDTYVDISSISNGESHLTRERGSSVWYLTKDCYW